MPTQSKYLSQKTYQLLGNLAPDGMGVEQLVLKMIDHYLGLDCDHRGHELYMRIPVKQDGCMDVQATVRLLDDILVGKESDNLIYVCRKCKRAKIYYR